MKKKFWLILLVVCILFMGISVDAKELDFNILYDSAIDCTGYFGNINDEKSLMHILVYNVFRPIQMLVPVILLVMTTIDFSKVVFTDSKDAMSKAKSNFVKRAIIAVVIFFIPYMLQLIFGFIDEEAIKSCLGKFN